VYMCAYVCVYVRLCVCMYVCVCVCTLPTYVRTKPNKPNCNCSFFTAFNQKLKNVLAQHYFTKILP
jgi:hypothetical protein